MELRGQVVDIQANKRENVLGNCTTLNLAEKLKYFRIQGSVYFIRILIGIFQALIFLQ